MPTCSETLQCFNESLQRCIIYLLSYAALQRFIEALSNLTYSSIEDNARVFEYHLQHECHVIIFLLSMLCVDCFWMVVKFMISTYFMA